MIGSDIALDFVSIGLCDMALDASDLATDEGLKTACLVSLYSDRRVNEDEIPQGELSRRGWWGDSFAEVEGDEIGSRLWLLAREKRTQEVLNRAEDYASEALAWLVQDGVASSVTVTGSWSANGQGWLLLAIDIQKPKGKISFQFELRWQAESARSEG